MTSLGSSLSRDTSRAGSAWTSRYSTGVRTSINSTGLPRSRMASSSLGVIVATLTKPSLQFLKLGTTSDPDQGLKQAKPSFSCLRFHFGRIVWISLRRSPCYNILGFINNYIPVWSFSQDMAATIPDEFLDLMSAKSRMLWDSTRRWPACMQREDKPL